tara:strand:+ start:5916 stop:6215 length:300 start_codon:yes stop_codon:yes gene_type:complete
MPHLRELVKLHEDQPFAIIGVNTGDSESDFRAGVEKFDVSWISAYQGEKSPIADLYRVQGYPTYVLLDTDGKIVKKGHSGSAMDGDIERLLKAAAKKGD